MKYKIQFPNGKYAKAETNEYPAPVALFLTEQAAISKIDQELTIAAKYGYWAVVEHWKNAKVVSCSA